MLLRRQQDGTRCTPFLKTLPPPDRRGRRQIRVNPRRSSLPATTPQISRAEGDVPITQGRITMIFNCRNAPPSPERSLPSRLNRKHAIAGLITTCKSLPPPVPTLFGGGIELLYLGTELENPLCSWTLRWLGIIHGSTSGAGASCTKCVNRELQLPKP